MNDPTKKHDDVRTNRPLNRMNTDHALKMANRASEKISEMEQAQFRNRNAKFIAESEQSQRPIRLADELAESYHNVNRARVRNRERKLAIDAADEATLRNRAKLIQNAQRFNSIRRDNTNVR